VLEVSGLVVRYGAATALDGISLEMAPGEMVAIIGPNGAGKTTLLNTLSGLLRPAAGSVHLDGRIGHVPEGRQLFGDLTVDDNLRLGAWRVRERDPTPVYGLFSQLQPLRRRLAGTLSGGEQQMVAVGRALMSKPDLLTADELSLGLAPRVVQTIVGHLRDRCRDTGMALLLVEQNARLALDLCQRAYVLEAGRIVMSGPSEELAQSPRIRAAYLGGAIEESA
jgi:branched-chain amino acid transport system ATP-binding protein